MVRRARRCQRCAKRNTSAVEPLPVEDAELPGRSPDPLKELELDELIDAAMDHCSENVFYVMTYHRGSKSMGMTECAADLGVSCAALRKDFQRCETRVRKMLEKG